MKEEQLNVRLQALAEFFVPLGKAILKLDLLEPGQRTTLGLLDQLDLEIQELIYDEEIPSSVSHELQDLGETLRSWVLLEVHRAKVRGTQV